jgi:molybdenum cofactor cytidylyltransferase
MERPSPPFVAALLLAAGESRRMGQIKQVMPFGDTTLLEASLQNLLASRVTEIIAVLGFEAERVKASMTIGPTVRIVINPSYREGIGTSIRCGLGSVSADASGLLIALADQPLIPPQVIDLLITRFTQSRHGIILPVYAGRRGHPVLFALPRYRRDLLKLTGDTGGRQIVGDNPDDVLEVEVPSEGILADIDNRADYRHMAAGLDGVGHDNDG